MKKKIWVVTELFYPEETAVAYIFTRIADFLSKDYEVCVICGPEFYDKNKINYRDNYQLSSGVEIIRINTLKFDKNSLIQRSLKIIILSMQMGFIVLTKISKRGTVILATNPAPLLLIVSIIKKFKKLNLHILVHDVFPENTIPAEIFKSKRSIGYRFLKVIFDRAYSNADHLIAIGRDMKNILIKKTNRFRNKPVISIVTNWSKPINLKSNFIENNFKLEEKYKEMIVLQYAGNIGRTQGLDVLIESFLLSNNPDIHLIIRGTGALYPFIENIINSKKIVNISLFGSYSRDDENYILSQCDISIVSLSKGMYGLGVPSKTYNILSAGKPILFIGEPDTEISLLVKENDIGWSFDNNNKSELINFFNNLNKNKLQEYQLKGQKARLLSERQYNEILILKLFQEQLEFNFKID
jgi:glycosyltransferase involved in cell wall biosynthesis